MKKQKITYQIALASTLAAFAVALDYLCTLKTDTSKYTIYGLPLLLAGMIFGPKIGALAGLAAGFISQVISYGLMPTTILWILAPCAWGLISGLIAKGFKYKFSFFTITFNVLLTSFIVLIINSFASIMDGLIGQYSTAFVYTTLLTRIITAGIVSIFYILMIMMIMPRLDPKLKKSASSKNIEIKALSKDNSLDVEIKIKK